MKANEMFQDVLDRLEVAVEAAARAKKEADEANAKARQLERDLKSAEERVSSLLAGQRLFDRQLAAALRLLTSDQRAEYEAALNPPKVDADGEAIPF